MGLSLALEIRRRLSAPRVVLLEKEPEVGLHASGRNSGVLHAGFYYGSDSLKARFCREGNRFWTEYCVDRGLPIRQCGKLVVATEPAEVAGVYELIRRGRANDVDVRAVSPEEVADIDPLVRAEGRALWSPTTSSVDPSALVQSLASDARDRGIEILTSTPFRSVGRQGLETGAGRLSAGYVVNAAGLHADAVARRWGFSQDHTILPFKGLYLKSRGLLPLKTHVYPVPDLRFPFLGVHFTLAADGAVKIGPTAIPAPWREGYGGLSGFRLAQAVEVGVQGARLFISDAFNFRRLAVQELKKRSRSTLVRMAQRFVRTPVPASGWSWGPPGIRAQLLNTRTRSLEMDFRVEGDDRSMHVLNAVSPAFTCAQPFAGHVVDLMERAMGHAGPAASESGRSGSL